MYYLVQQEFLLRSEGFRNHISDRNTKKRNVCDWTELKSHRIGPASITHRAGQRSCTSSSSSHTTNPPTMAPAASTPLSLLKLTSLVVFFRMPGLTISPGSGLLSAGSGGGLSCRSSIAAPAPLPYSSSWQEIWLEPAWGCAGGGSGRRRRWLAAGWSP